MKVKGSKWVGLVWIFGIRGSRWPAARARISGRDMSVVGALKMPPASGALASDARPHSSRGGRGGREETGQAPAPGPGLATLRRKLAAGSVSERRRDSRHTARVPPWRRALCWTGARGHVHESGRPDCRTRTRSAATPAELAPELAFRPAKLRVHVSAGVAV
eukprot:scaffold2803_cov347-Prasinococcus_capsulatus_cf.AAC.10